MKHTQRQIQRLCARLFTLRRSHWLSAHSDTHTQKVIITDYQQDGAHYILTGYLHDKNNRLSARWSSLRYFHRLWRMTGHTIKHTHRLSARWFSQWLRAASRTRRCLLYSRLCTRMWRGQFPGSSPVPLAWFLSTSPRNCSRYLDLSSAHRLHRIV